MLVAGSFLKNKQISIKAVRCAPCAGLLVGAFGLPGADLYALAIAGMLAPSRACLLAVLVLSWLSPVPSRILPLNQFRPPAAGLTWSRPELLPVGWAWGYAFPWSGARGLSGLSPGWLRAVLAPACYYRGAGLFIRAGAGLLSELRPAGSGPLC